MCAFSVKCKLPDELFDLFFKIYSKRVVSFWLRMLHSRTPFKFDTDTDDTPRRLGALTQLPENVVDWKGMTFVVGLHSIGFHCLNAPSHFPGHCSRWAEIVSACACGRRSLWHIENTTCLVCAGSTRAINFPQRVVKIDHLYPERCFFQICFQFVCTRFHFILIEFQMHLAAVIFAWMMTFFMQLTSLFLPI